MRQPLFDAHAHAFPDAIAPAAMKSLVAGARWIPVHPVHDGTVAGLVATMDRAGIDATILCSVATRPGQVRKITDWSAAVASPRVIPFASIHPDYDQPEAEAQRIAQRGLRGIKLHPQYMNCPADDPRMLRIARAAATHGLAVAVHGGHDLAYERDDLACPRRLRTLHEAAPDLRLQLCHLGGWHDWEQSLQLLAGRPIYLETSYCFGHCEPSLLHNLVERHGREYLLFGTDSPWADPAGELEKFYALGLGPQRNRQALWDNACRFLNLPATWLGAAS